MFVFCTEKNKNYNLLQIDARCLQQSRHNRRSSSLLVLCHLIIFFSVFNSIHIYAKCNLILQIFKVCKARAVSQQNFLQYQICKKCENSCRTTENKNSPLFQLCVAFVGNDVNFNFFIKFLFSVVFLNYIFFLEAELGFQLFL